MSWEFVEPFLILKVTRVVCVLDVAAMSGRPKAPAVLTYAEREELKTIAFLRKTARALALRACIVLACTDGQDNKVFRSASAVHR